MVGVSFVARMRRACRSPEITEVQVAGPARRACSSYAREAAGLLGQTIRAARIERRQTVAEIAERAGISRGLVQRIERGAPGCSIGSAFEVAAIVGVRLFGAGPDRLARELGLARDKLALLPRAVRYRSGPVRDDF